MTLGFEHGRPLQPVGADKLECLRRLQGTECWCGGPKESGRTFCWDCWAVLPRNLAADASRSLREPGQAKVVARAVRVLQALKRAPGWPVDVRRLGIEGRLEEMLRNGIAAEAREAGLQAEIGAEDDGAGVRALASAIVELFAEAIEAE